MAFQDEKDAQLLEQMTDEEFWQQARMIAAQAAMLPSPSDSATLHQYLECELEQCTCFVPLHAIEAVIPASSSLARLPFAPRWLRGVQAWRGEIVAVVDLNHYLSGTDTPASSGMLLIARHPECIIGLYVPGVGLTTSIEPEQLTPATDSAPVQTAVIQGVYNGYPVLDMAALLADVALQVEMAAHYD
jgi:chemotaxis signal transduction protein